MSSKIEIDKNCEYCGKLYIARTLYTRYCSHTCNKKGYKAIKRQERINNHEIIASKKKIADVAMALPVLAEIKAKDFLSVTETCALVGVSRNTLFRWIKGNLLPTYQHGTKHLIKKEDINKIFNDGK
jgi:excisionase family DNA binding protein